ncbi:MAG: hypothetical protein ABI134_26235 [Byssovorax sp.]
MRALTSPMTLRSRGLLPAVLTFSLVGLAAGLSGCFWTSSSEPEPEPPIVDPPVLDTPQQVAITPDKTLQADAGEGVGIFVEYATGGHWHVWTSCDTNKSQVACDFEVFAIPEKGAKIANVQAAETLESGDVAEELTDGSAHLSASTSTEFDGMTFDSTPGALVELEVYFDGVPDSRVVFWFGNETLHTGAPTDPIDFVPEAP